MKDKIGVSKLNLKKGEMVVLKTDTTLTDTVYEHILKQVKEHLPEGTKVLLFEGGMDIGIFPPREKKYYGLWIPSTDCWAASNSGSVINSLSLGVIRIQQVSFNILETEIRVFNDDGTPGELVKEEKCVKKE